MNIETILKLFSSDTVSGLLAIGGIVALVTSIVGYLKPPDDFCFVDRRRRQWTDAQSNRYFDEKQQFERLQAAGNRGFGNSLLFLLWLLILVTVIVGGAISHATVGQFTILSLIIMLAWLTLIVIVARWVGYRWRKAERYLAFLDGKDNWMVRRRPRH